ncbi:hypothetical protein J3459_022472 [Metarhizium acridum]|nr:hypothetical protein J3458_003005 [Metarhizium acridum]KAG8428343.1 hypothetical protein J3459_022472 [Metarhizium acridum]
MSNHPHLDSTDRVDDKAPNDDNNGSYPPSSQKAVRSSSTRPTLVETWLESVRSKCSSNGPQNDDPADTSWDKTRSRQTSYLQSADESDKILHKTHIPVCSSELFIPLSPCLQDDPDSLNRQMLGGPELELLRTGGRFRSESSRHCFIPPPPRPENHHLCEKFHRQPRRKTREDRYDTKPPITEDQDGTDRPARLQNNHRMRRKRRLRSGKELMKNFASDAVKKEHVTMRPHVAEDLLSEERPLSNTTCMSKSLVNMLFFFFFFFPGT